MRVDWVEERGREMDTTAAAELGAGIVGPGPNGAVFWDGGTADPDSWPDDNYDQTPEVGNSRGPDGGGGGWGKGTGRRSYGRQGRPPPWSESSHKRMRNMSGEFSADHSGGGQGYGGRPGSGGGYADGSGYNGFSAPVYGVSDGFSAPMYGVADNGLGSQTSRGNSGYGPGQAQGGMRGTNSFSGDPGSGLGPSTPGSSGGAGATASSPLTGKGKGIGSIFFKTKLCSKFRAGICPYNSNCNFAHGMEELRKPPPGWEDIVAAQEAERGSRSRDGQSEANLMNQAPGGSSDSQRFHKTRPCKKYYSDEGCPYGDRCNFLHDDQSSQARVVRESNAINLGPTSSTGSGGAGGGGGAGNGSERPMNWKTRICNKWETTGHCPFGQKCHFAHGLTELQKYGGGPVDSDSGATSGGGPRSDTKQGRGASSISHPDIGSSPASALYGTDGYNSAPNSRHGGGVAASLQSQRPYIKFEEKWKGPADEISTIYGDWIEEDEWDHAPISIRQSTDQAAVRVNEFSSRDGRKEENLVKSQQSKLNTHQPNVSFSQGPNDHDSSGQRHHGLNDFSGFTKVGSGSLPLVHGEPKSTGDGGVDAEDGWDGEL